MTLAELEAGVRELLADSDVSGFFCSDSIKSWLNQAQLKIARTVKHLRKIYTADTADIDSYDLPADYLGIFQLKVNDIKVNPIPLEEAGISQGYYIWDGKIVFSPYMTSGNSYSLYYFARPAEMIDNLDEPDVPEEYQDLLIDFALYRANQKERQNDIAEQYRRDFLEGLMQMKRAFGVLPSRKTVDVKRR